MSIKERFERLKRGNTLFRSEHEKLGAWTYYKWTVIGGLAAGSLLCLAMLITAAVVDSVESLNQVDANRIVTVLVVAVIAIGLLIHIAELLSFFYDPEVSIFRKIFRPIIGLPLFLASIYGGVYAFIFVLFILGCMLLLFIGSLMAEGFSNVRHSSEPDYSSSSSSSSSSSEEEEKTDTIYELENGRTIKESSYYNMAYHDDEGNRYQKNIHGDFERD